MAKAPSTARTRFGLDQVKAGCASSPSTRSTAASSSIPAWSENHLFTTSGSCCQRS